MQSANILLGRTSRIKRRDQFVKSRAQINVNACGGVRRAKFLSELAMVGRNARQFVGGQARCLEWQMTGQFTGGFQVRSPGASSRNPVATVGRWPAKALS